MPNLDTQLVTAIDQFLAKLRAMLLQRVIVGESYDGAWQQMTVSELQTAIQEELLDAFVYQSMIDSKQREGT